jgi:hypothetical protein
MPRPPWLQELESALRLLSLSQATCGSRLPIGVQSGSHSVIFDVRAPTSKIAPGSRLYSVV